MAQPFKIKFSDKKTGGNHIVEGEFPDDEWDKLLAFTDEAEKLKNSKILSGKFSVSARLNWNISSGVNFECELPHDDDVATLLHRMRPFILQKEDTSFYVVCKILSRRLNNGYLRAVIERQHAEFSGKDFQGTINISSNDVPLNSDEMLHKWLNAYEYHRDLDKKKEIEALHQLLPLEYSRAIFISMIVDKARAVIEIARVIQGFRERGGIEYKFRTYKDVDSG